MKKLVLVVLVVLGCSSLFAEDMADASIEEAEEEPYIGVDGDPFENINRSIFEFNRGLDKYALRVVSEGYIRLTSEDFRECSYNFFYNLSLPLNSVSRVFAFDIKNSLKAIARFVINIGLGFCGCFDPATKFGITVENHDMRTVLSRYGMPSKPYIMLPILGPSCPRDIIGTVMNFFIDPLGCILPEGWLWRRRIMNVIMDRSENFNTVDEVLHNSENAYEMVRGSAM